MTPHYGAVALPLTLDRVRWVDGDGTPVAGIVRAMWLVVDATERRCGDLPVRPDVWLLVERADSGALVKVGADRASTATRSSDPPAVPASSAVRAAGFTFTHGTNMIRDYLRTLATVPEILTSAGVVS